MAITFRKIVVTGGREFMDALTLASDMISMLRHGTTDYAHGGARGADSMVSAAALCHPSPPVVRVYAVDRSLDGPWPAAGNIRNRRMLKAEMPNAVLAYPDPSSRGTWNCVADAYRMGIPVAILAPEGKLREEAQALRIRLMAGSVEVADRIVLVPAPHSVENVAICDALAAHLEGLTSEVAFTIGAR